MFTALFRKPPALTGRVYNLGCCALFLILTCMPGMGAAEVVNAEPQGFVLMIETQIAAPPAEAWAALVSGIGRWWHAAHTFSGDAANLSIDAQAGGCFCEQLGDGGSVRHMEIVFAAPGKLLRMRGGLGPLQGLAVAGAMDWQLHEHESGTRLELRYSVGGYLPDGLDAWARPVDSVLTEQLQRLRLFVETGNPEGTQKPDDAEDSID